MKISKHAINQFRSQSPNPQDKYDDEQISTRILEFWEKGEIQTGKQYGFATKFQKYDFEELQNTEHRRFNNLVMTMVNDTIVTTHFKTKTENRRDKRKDKKKKHGFIPWYNRK